VLGQFQTGHPGLGEINGAKLDRAGEEQHSVLWKSEAFECYREDLGEVEMVGGHKQ
jgi:hypothetical protein